ncbi:hypothetical protein DFH09DRAFT_1087376 [Mycena vulgaris]|nr:hypothetical protein DFH09DRAFT_1087376 [Mycena vulgaris]
MEEWEGVQRIEGEESGASGRVVVQPREWVDHIANELEWVKLGIEDCDWSDWVGRAASKAQRGRVEWMENARRENATKMEEIGRKRMRAGCEEGQGKRNGGASGETRDGHRNQEGKGEEGRVARANNGTCRTGQMARELGESRMNAPAAHSPASLATAAFPRSAASCAGLRVGLEVDVCRRARAGG